MAPSRDDAFVFPARLVEKAMRLAEREQRSKALENDIETVLEGGEVSPDAPPDLLQTAAQEMEADEPWGRVVIFDPATGNPLDPQPYATPKTRPVTGVESAPKSVKTTEQPLLTGVNSEKTGRGGAVPPKAHRFKPGQSGNPSGRPRNSMAKLIRDVLVAGDQKYAKQIIKTLVERACNGNLSAIRELLNRAAPQIGEDDPAERGNG